MSLTVQDRVSNLQAAWDDFRNACERDDKLEVVHKAALDHLDNGGDSYCMLKWRPHHYQKVVPLLSVAAKYGWIDVMERVIEGYRKSKRPVDSPNTRGKPPLMEALRNEKQCAAMVKLLVQEGANVNLQYKKGSPWKLAIISGKDAGVLRALRQAGGDTKQLIFDEPILLYAVSKGFEGLLEVALEDSSPKDVLGKDGITALHVAAKNGQTKMIPLLIQHGAIVDSPDINGQTPLMYALGARKSDAVQALLQARASKTTVDKAGKTPLYLAVENSLPEIVKLLLSDPSVDRNRGPEGKTPFLLALERKNRGIAEELYNQGADIVCAGKTGNGSEGFSSLHLAANWGYLEFVKAILHRGVSVDIRSSAQETPLDRATRSGHFEVVRLLLERGANVNCVDSEEYAPIHTAARLINVKLVKLLHSYGANLNLQTKEGYTPLQRVVQYMDDGNQNKADELLRYLLENGANPTIADRKGHTPYQHLREGHFSFVAQHLRSSASDRKTLVITEDQNYKMGRTNGLADALKI